MSSIYEEHKDEDGFLYITYVTARSTPPPPFDLFVMWLTVSRHSYSGENTFGFEELL